MSGSHSTRRAGRKAGRSLGRKKAQKAQKRQTLLVGVGALELLDELAAGWGGELGGSVVFLTAENAESAEENRNGREGFRDLGGFALGGRKTYPDGLA